MEISTAKSDYSDLDDISIYQFELINNFDRFIVFDRDQDKTIWISKKCEELNYKVCLGASVLSTCLVITDDYESAKILSSIIFTINNNSQQLIKLKNIKDEHEIFKLNCSKITLKISPLQKSLLAQSRYLEDREKLIFTSRSITVSEMASTLAHEINQPIGTINNLLFGVKSRLKKLNGVDREVIDAVDKSIEQIKYTSDIITRIRDYTQSREPKLSVVEIKHLIDKCISLMDWEMRNTNFELKHYLSTSDAKVFVDELMIQQVIVNLIRNGMDANYENNSTESKIVVSTSMNNNYVEIAIMDNGKGMTKKEVDSIFIPFASNKSTGMGIGLNICRSFIELHKGKLWLTQNKDLGCTSHIMLPLMS